MTTTAYSSIVTCHALSAGGGGPPPGSYSFGAITNGNNYLDNGNNLGLPSSYRYALLSAWFQSAEGANNTEGIFVFGSTAPGSGTASFFANIQLIPVPPSYTQWQVIIGGGGPSCRLQIGSPSSTTGYLDSFFAPGTAVSSYVPTTVWNNALLSVDSVGQIIQLYINDQPIDLSHLSWTGSGNMSNDAAWRIAPGDCQGDLWWGPTASFGDLTVTANRRKFINADLSPVDLGSNGQAPFGSAPPVFMHLDAADTTASDWLTNLGTGGAFPNSSPPITLCVPITPPPPTPTSLAMDNLLVIAPTGPQIAEEIFLDWSDDRGHSFGNPVGHTLGPPGSYHAIAQWQRLGYARDRVFRLTWAAPVKTALQGAFIDVEAAAKT